MVGRPTQISLQIVTKDDVKNSKFFQMPKWLKEMKISNNAKLLYTYALSRIHLSIKNNWVDDDGNVFCWYRRTDMADDLNTSVRSISRYLKELRDEGLLSCVQVYAQMPAQIYLYYPTEVQVKETDVAASCEKAKWQDNIVYPREVAGQKLQSGRTKMVKVAGQKWPTSNTNISNTNTIRQTRVRACAREDALDDVDGGVLQALSLIKNKITTKDRELLLELQKTYGKESLMRSIVSVRAQGTTVHSVAYLETMLENDKKQETKPLWQNTPYLGVQPIETRYSKAEMDDIIARKIAEAQQESRQYEVTA